MAPAPSLAAALVAGIRRHGSRPARLGGPSWTTVADDGRTLALGLLARGWGDRRRIRVRAEGLDLASLVSREVAVLAAGAVLVLDDDAGHDVEISSSEVDGPGARLPLAEVLAAGRRASDEVPDAHETHLAALDPAAVAVASARSEATNVQMDWALRSVVAWLGAPVPQGPVLVVGPRIARPGESVASALVGRWWPALGGAALVDRSAAESDLAVVRRSRPDVVVLDPDGWRTVADAVRAAGDRSRTARATLRGGRAAAAGESTGTTSRARLAAARRWSRQRSATAAGLDRLAAGVCLGPLGVVDGRDLAAIGLPVAAVWTDPAVPAPVAASSFTRADGARWGRPLPGRSVEVGDEVVVHGGDLPASGRVAGGPARIDRRGRVEVGATRR